MRDQMAADRRKPRHVHQFFIPSALSIARESAIVLLKHLSFFTSIAVLLMFPISAASMVSRGFLHHLPITQMASQIQPLFHVGSFAETHHPTLISYKLSETIIYYMLCFPFAVSFSLLARGAVANTVAYVYAGNKPSWQRVMEALPRLWKCLVVTCIWGCLLVFGCSVLIFVLLWTLINFLSFLGLSSRWELWAALCGGIVFSVVVAHAIIVNNLATIVCVVEDGCCGVEAIYRAKFLIRGRNHVALLMVVITNLGFASVEKLFEYGMMGRLVHDKSWWFLWEALVLIFMYSLMAVMDVVMGCVFYYTCKAARLDDLCLHTPLEDELSASLQKKDIP